MTDGEIPAANLAPADLAAPTLVGAAAFADGYGASVADPPASWGREGRWIDRIRPFTRIKDTEFTHGHFSIKGFEDGTLNVSANCFDRHVARRRSQTAITWEPDDPATPARHIISADLMEGTYRMANGLKGLGIVRGDRAVLDLPMTPKAAQAKLACARCGGAAPQPSQTPHSSTTSSAKE